MRTFLVTQAAVGVLFRECWRRRKLTMGGCCTGWLLATVLCLADQYALLASLVVFLVVCSAATKIGRQAKAKMLHNYDPEGHRTYKQVLANGGVPILFAALWWLTGQSGICEPALAALSTSFGDTLASELAPLTEQVPRSIVAPWKVVKRGSNGGVTINGIFLSMTGGWLTGGVYGVIRGLTLQDCGLLAINCGLYGVVGSLLDSWLGATLERDPLAPDAAAAWRPLGNNSVNFLSALIVAGFVFFS